MDKEGDMPPPNFLYLILGPTASGKTGLAVALAKKLAGEIISVDSRQVYRGMDIGTGKDLDAYGAVPYHLIDIRDPKERYDIAQFQTDFRSAYTNIVSRGKTPIAVGGTGMYMHSLLISQPYIHVPINADLRDQLTPLDKQTLIQRLQRYTIPADFKIDQSSQKRLVRAIEILDGLSNGFTAVKESAVYQPLIFGLNPGLELRRKLISDRLRDRMANGLMEEVEELLKGGLSHSDLQYYGLEYKYASLYLLGELNRESFFRKLETEIHRYAKRQMTFFRKMEKDGLDIHWLKKDTQAEQLAAALQVLERM